MTAQVGAPAPDFSLPADGGETITLSALRGKHVVLYFYPKDDTPGCTTEAKDFTAMAEEFKAAGAVVIGMSRDTATKHDKFIAKHDLKVKLAADVDGSATEAYGVWVEKNMYGRTYMGIERATYLIDDKGVVRQVWRKVRVKGHAQAVLDAVKAL
ncbi:thioredoxin-dependent thiol peroxidase [Kordiimonas sp.]|uniref:thioredoxin-dependent thiol peroxidase n=1 Tax=Kordiimonas sp. TaxID=1970157 RepID=UPI003A944B2D